VPEEKQGEPLLISVVSPCYNEAAVLPELVRRLSQACETATAGDFEIILVDDGSTDGTWGKIRNIAEVDNHVVAVKLSRNHGHQLALSAGLALARGDRVLIIDADLQDPPELLSQMMEAMDQGADVVYGRRIARHGETRMKKSTAFIFYRLLFALTDIPIPTDTGDFRLMSRRSLNVLLSMPEQHRFIRGMVSWVGFSQKPVNYERQPRLIGETKYPPSKMIRFALDAITGFSTRPLRFASHIGALVGFLAILLLGNAVVDWMLGYTIQGWTSSIGATLLLGSINLFMLGIIGEYLGRLYIEAKRRPLFIIEDVVRSSQPKDGPARVSQAHPL
jgi:polyisoprenyl-phosphate glycosyltransferase